MGFYIFDINFLVSEFSFNFHNYYGTWKGLIKITRNWTLILRNKKIIESGGLGRVDEIRANGCKGYS